MDKLYRAFYGGLWLASTDGEHFYPVSAEPTPGNAAEMAAEARTSQAEGKYVWKRAGIERMSGRKVEEVAASGLGQ